MLPCSNLPMRIFGPCRSTMMPDGAAELTRDLAHQLGALRRDRRAVPWREVHTHHVHARGNDAREHLAVGAGRAEGGDDLGASLHGLDPDLQRRRGAENIENRASGSRHV